MFSGKLYYLNSNLTLLSINGKLLWNREIITCLYQEMFLASVNDGGGVLPSTSNGSVTLLKLTASRFQIHVEANLGEEV